MPGRHRGIAEDTAVFRRDVGSANVVAELVLSGVFDEEPIEIGLARNVVRSSASRRGLISIAVHEIPKRICRRTGRAKPIGNVLERPTRKHEPGRDKHVGGQFLKRPKVVTECGLDEVTFLDARGLHVLLQQVLRLLRDGRGNLCWPSHFI